MAELVTIARPYAAAAFNHAKEHRQLPQWSDMLGLMAGVLQDPAMQPVLQNPNLTRSQVERALHGVFGERIDGAARNLLTLLVHNDRLDAVPAIRDMFEQLKAEEDNQVEARIESAFPMSDEQARGLVQRLEVRTGHKVKPVIEVAPELIGGVRVTVGDDVWDASVRGQLENLAAALTR
jgi:F-type H+-transporting ATPase subunit delta